MPYSLTRPILLAIAAGISPIGAAQTQAAHDGVTITFLANEGVMLSSRAGCRAGLQWLTGDVGAAYLRPP